MSALFYRMRKKEKSIPILRAGKDSGGVLGAHTRQEKKSLRSAATKGAQGRHFGVFVCVLGDVGVSTQEPPLSRVSIFFFRSFSPKKNKRETCLSRLSLFSATAATAPLLAHPCNGAPQFVGGVAFFIPAFCVAMPRRADIEKKNDEKACVTRAARTRPVLLRAAQGQSAGIARVSCSSREEEKGRHGHAQSTRPSTHKELCAYKKVVIRFFI
nr:hypothetical protein [Pandoravirus massiliensis]